MRLDFCALCGEKDSAALEHHHFLPRAMGGSDDETNMFTVCGSCHGKVHDIPRPFRLGELVKAGVAKAQERTADDWQDIAAKKSKQAEQAQAKAFETAQRAARDAEKALKQHIAEARRRANPNPVQVTATVVRFAPVLSARKSPSISRERFSQMQKDKQFRVSGRWALASDGVQWVIQHQTGPNSWLASKFIHSDKAWLEYRLRQMAPKEDADRLLIGLPNTFDEWREMHWHEIAGRLKERAACPDEKTVMTAPNKPAGHVLGFKEAA
jgi:hypothetical protein